ncbi:MAG: serine/threonine protein phosphatase [Chloroflexota bacterium]|nr:MAG: serine/threonine protein phosphatase [Chloroflexota bacterium]
MNATSRIIVGRLAENRTGRDIVIGDLHGHADRLLRLMDRERFDPARDRIIACGDLADRGPASRRCLNLLSEPWFFSVRGNHDQHFIDQVVAILFAVANRGIGLEDALRLARPAAESMESEWVLDWLKDRYRSDALADADRLAALANSMPHILVVGQDQNRFQVVHAEAWENGNPLSNAAIDGGLPGASAGLADRLLWGRTVFAAMDCFPDIAQTNEPGISPTFCGHNVVREVSLWRNHIFMDTGCGFDYENWMRLSAFVVQEGRVVSI